MRVPNLFSYSQSPPPTTWPKFKYKHKQIARKLRTKGKIILRNIFKRIIKHFSRIANCTLPESWPAPTIATGGSASSFSKARIQSMNSWRVRSTQNSILILCIFMQFNVSCPTPPPPLPCQLQGRNGQDGADRPTAWKWKCTQHTFRNNNSKSQPLVSPTTGFYPPTFCTNNNTSTTATIQPGDQRPSRI